LHRYQQPQVLYDFCVSPYMQHTIKLRADCSQSLSDDRS